VPIAIANGPVSWGVYYGGDPTNYPWQRYLDEVAAAGFAWTELGPIGYLPEDAGRLRDELGKRKLGLVGGFIFDSLHDPAERERLVALTHRTCRVLASQNAKHYVIIDNLPEERAKTAGRSDAAPRLSGEAWAAFMATIAALARIAREEYGLVPVVHPHVGGSLEFADEVDAALNDLPDDLVGLCLDTGHLAYAGVDPIALYERAAPRVRYLHFKNISRDAHRKALEQKLDLFSAIPTGVFCPLGDGVVDFVRLKASLDAHFYDGFATIEQDSDPRAGARPSEDAAASLGFLRRIGLVGDGAKAAG
jgi:inosose dehydratase